MRIPDLNLDLVRCFVTVVETGGFTQASKRLHLTQSAITQKIKRLENLLQRRLFVRTIKPLELSAEGEILLTYAPRLLGLSREMVQRVSKPPQNEALRGINFSFKASVGFATALRNFPAKEEHAGR